jgi:hypothetical protein
MVAVRFPSLVMFVISARVPFSTRGWPRGVRWVVNAMRSPWRSP